MLLSCEGIGNVYAKGLGRLGSRVGLHTNVSLMLFDTQLDLRLAQEKILKVAIPKKSQPGGSQEKSDATSREVTIWAYISHINSTTLYLMASDTINLSRSSSPRSRSS
ncbi:hypothetical protein ACMFMG_010590 [Clarireedia jacksonii]